MARKLFGTDGVRGKANAEPITAETVLRLAMGAARHLRRGDYRHLAVIGKDTRLSGYMLEPALTAGFISMGMDVVLVGPMPTPAVAMLTRSLRADLGVMISASHNPFQDNGIKLFGPNGYKLSDEGEESIEAAMQVNGDGLAGANSLGRARRLEDAPGRYIEFVKHTFAKGRRLDGLKIVVDCAHGAAYKVAPTVFWELGAEVIPIGVTPNGKNINLDCGAAFPSYMCEQVVEHGAHIGIALDGDADRLIIADEQGRVLDGDQVMAVIANSWQKTDRLRGGGVVATVMSNLGLERYLQGLGLDLIRTAVGDRYVVEAMRGHGYNLGGEQSGHIIMKDYVTTGDALISALQVLAVLAGNDQLVSDVCRVFEPVPQFLQNVAISGAEPLACDHVKAAIKEGEQRIGKSGRLLIRPSGTEPVIRVMAEGDDKALIGSVVADISVAIEEAAKE